MLENRFRRMFVLHILGSFVVEVQYIDASPVLTITQDPRSYYWKAKLILLHKLDGVGPVDNRPSID